jgi:hypothetical protein
LGFLKDRIAGQFRFQEIGDDEAIGFLHNQLLSQADRRVEARGFRRGISVGLAVGGAALAASVAAFTCIRNPNKSARRPQVSAERRNLPGTFWTVRRWPA